MSHTSNLSTIRPLKMKAVGPHITRIWASVPSRSQSVEHIVCLNVATGEARHAEKACRCPAANHGRKCWHVASVVDAARAAGYLPKPAPSVWDTPPRRDRDEEV